MGMYDDVSAALGRGVVSHLQPSDAAALEKLTKQMDDLAAATFMMSNKRMKRLVKPLVKSVNAQFRRTLSHASSWSSQAFDRQGALGGMSTALQGAAAQQVMTVRHGLSRYMSPTLQASAEMVAMAAMRTHTNLFMAAQMAEHARVREWRNAAMDMMVRDIEVGYALRGVSDEMRKVAGGALVAAAESMLSKQTHELNMRKINWEKARAEKAQKNAQWEALGSLAGNFFAGTAKGLEFGTKAGAPAPKEL